MFLYYVLFIYKVDSDYFLAEVSFEAGNKVGGIWTVLTSKSAYIEQLCGKNYLAIGFYNPSQAAVEFIEATPPQYINDAIAEFGLEGVKIYFGKWTSANDVDIVLIDSKEFEKNHVNEVKKEFWDQFKIDSLNSPEDYNEPLAWAYVAGAFVEAISKHVGLKLVVQAHEWLSAGAILYLKSKQIPLPSVFTTHATVLGRAMAYSGEDMFSFINGAKVVDAAAPYKYGVAAKHFTEKAGANNATVFTTVSDIVRKEAELVLGKGADIVTINGIDLIDLPHQEDLDLLRFNAQKKLKNFVDGYFLPYYEFPRVDLPVFTTAGRYEFYDKGYDLFIDALGQLDKSLSGDKYVLAMISVPSGTIGLKNEVVANYLTYLSIKSSLDEDVKNFDQLVTAFTDSNAKVLDKAYSKILNDTRRLSAQLTKQKPTNPPLCPFMLSYQESDDLIIKKLRENGLDNSQTNHVKVIFYPKYLTVGDELLNLTYNELLAASTAGFFLSKYEPFGYTPLEAASYMSMAFTTDHSGFGDYCEGNVKTTNPGIFIEKLVGKNRTDVVKHIAADMLNIVSMNEDARLKLRLSARQTAEQFGWAKFIPLYARAYDAALRAS